MAWGKGKKDSVPSGAHIPASQANAQPRRVARLKTEVQQEENNIQQIYTQIGKKYVEMHRNNFGEEFSSFMRDLNACRSQIKLLNMQIQKEEGILICPECNRSISIDSVYCNYCGRKQESIDVGYYTICKSCGELIRKDAITCPYCGDHSVVTPAGNGGESFIDPGDPTVLAGKEPLVKKTDPVSPPPPPPVKKRICKECGKELEGQQKYCRFCGTKYTESE